jgi:GntR family transcriptional repressor for pyruvate dehydrogenase complex
LVKPLVTLQVFSVSTTPKTKIADEVFVELQTQILSGRYTSGDRLPPERELAQTLDTNRNTLREAIRRLEQARLVTVRQGQGVTVADFRHTGTIELLEPFLMVGEDTSEKLRALTDLLAARSWVLEYALGLAARRADVSDINKLSDIRRLLMTAYTAEDRSTLAAGFQHWMSALVDAAHSLPTRWVANPFLELNRSFMEKFPTLWVLDESFPRYLLETEKAISSGDAERARKANRQYYERVDARINELLRQVFVHLGPHGGPPITPDES